MARWCQTAMDESAAGRESSNCLWTPSNNSQVHMVSYIIIYSQITQLLHNESRVTLTPVFHWELIVYSTHKLSCVK